MDGKVIIWSRFRYDIRKIEAALKKKYGPDSTVTYFGDTTSDQREEAKKKSKKATPDSVRNPQTKGLTLHAATNVIYYANDFNLESRVQSEDRVASDWSASSGSVCGPDGSADD